ncbi:MAG: hypothetical protein ACR2PA_15715 [Hyphomicrobiaceae bacterium]
MPQLIALAVAGSVAYAGYRWIVKQNQRMAQAAKAQRSAEPRDLGELHWDEAAGVYRPRQDT